MWPRLCIWMRPYFRVVKENTWCTKRLTPPPKNKQTKKTTTNEQTNNNNNIRIIVTFCQLQSYSTAHKSKKTQLLCCDLVEKMVRNILTGHKGSTCRGDGSARQENARDGYSELWTVLTMQGHHCPATNVTSKQCAGDVPWCIDVLFESVAFIGYSVHLWFVHTIILGYWNVYIIQCVNTGYP